MTNPNRLNPYAPPVYNGVNDCSPAGFRDVDHTYPFDVTLTSNDIFRGILQTDTDADFAMWGFVIAYSSVAVIAPAATTNFSLKLSDGNGYWFSNELLSSENFLGTGASPFPMSPGQILVPRGGQIYIEIQCQAAALVTKIIELQFRGAKRFRK